MATVFDVTMAIGRHLARVFPKMRVMVPESGGRLLVHMHAASFDEDGTLRCVPLTFELVIDPQALEQDPCETAKQIARDLAQRFFVAALGRGPRVSPGGERQASKPKAKAADLN